MQATKSTRRTSKRGRKVLSIAALRSFRLIYGSIRQYFRSVEHLCGVSGSQLWMLQEIKRRPGIGVSELATQLSIHQSTCSLLVEKLASSRLVVRSRVTSDQRRVGLRLTQKGHRTVARAPGPLEGVLPHALQALSGASLESLNRSLQMVIDRLELKSAGAAERPLSEL